MNILPMEDQILMIVKLKMAKLCVARKVFLRKKSLPRNQLTRTEDTRVNVLMKMVSCVILTVKMILALMVKELMADLQILRKKLLRINRRLLLIRSLDRMILMLLRTHGQVQGKIYQ